MVRFLRFVVTHAVEQRPEPLKEYAIGVEAFDKTADFDPKADPLVRVEARRLRVKLREYYADEGRTDPLMIALPDRGYTPSFQWLHTPASTAAIPVRRSKLVLPALVSSCWLQSLCGWLAIAAAVSSPARELLSRYFHSPMSAPMPTMSTSVTVSRMK